MHQPEGFSIFQKMSQSTQHMTPWTKCTHADLCILDWNKMLQVEIIFISIKS